MATLSLIRAKTDPDFPPNITAEFRFGSTSMGTLTFPNADQWQNFAPNTKYFSTPNKLKLYMGEGVLVDTCPNKINPSPQQTAYQRILSCNLGTYTVEYNVTP